jgi:hypothetical protein
MKKTGKSWNCAVCEIKNEDLYSRFKKIETKQIQSDRGMMMSEDRDAPKIENKRIQSERAMMMSEDQDAPKPAPIIIKIKRRRPVLQGQKKVKTLEPSPIPPPMALQPANPNTKTAVSLKPANPLTILFFEENYDDENQNNIYRYEIMLALTYLVPKRLSANDQEDKKTYGVYGRDDQGKLYKMSEVKSIVVTRLKNIYGKPFTGRDATKIADEIVKPGEKSHRIKVMIKYMNDHLDIGLPDEVTPDWKFKYLRSYETIQNWSHKADTIKDTHTNIFRTIDMILDNKEYSDGIDVGLPEEAEGPLSPLHIHAVAPSDAKLYDIRKELRERLNKSRTKKNRETIVTLNDEISALVKPILKAELESGYFTSGFSGTQAGDGDPKRITFELNGIDVVFRDEDGNIIPTLGNSKLAPFLNSDDPVIQLHRALRRQYIWRGYGGRNGSVELNVLKETERLQPSEEFRELVSNVFR